MKKLLLSTLLSVLFMGGAVAQLRWGTYTSTSQNGQTLKAVNIANKDTLLLDFKTITPTPVCAWAVVTKGVNIGKDSVYKKTLQTQRGIQVKAFLDKTTTTAFEDGSFKCNNAGGNGNPGRFASIDSLKAYLTHSVKGTATVGGNTSDSISRPAACLFNSGTDEVVFGMYPGRAKVIEYLYRFDYTAKACSDDITFEMNTYDAGNTGKTAVYQMAVYKNSVSTANLIGDTVNVYTTGQGLKTVNLAQEIGVTPADLSNKSLYVVIKTYGTSNASGVIDGLPNLPTVQDPTIVFDNFILMYAASSWSAPSGVIASAVFNHNDGSPVYVGQSATDFSGGTPVSAFINDTTKITINLIDINRIGAITIKEANDGGGHSANFSFTNTGSVKKKINGVFTDIPYTYVPYEATTPTAMVLTIPAPTSGSVNDTLQIISSAVNIPSASARTVRYEIDNGIRFWYNVGAQGSLYTGNQSLDVNKVTIYAFNNTVFVSNATENVIITNINGQRVKISTAIEASKGINLQTGLYIVKTGNSVQKVLVK